MTRLVSWYFDWFTSGNGTTLTYTFTILNCSYYILFKCYIGFVQALVLVNKSWLSNTSYRSV